jgi:hypothetical protein
MYVHVVCSAGEARFWIEPSLELARSHSLARTHLKENENIVEEHYDEFKGAWNQRSGS